VAASSLPLALTGEKFDLGRRWDLLDHS